MNLIGSGLVEILTLIGFASGIGLPVGVPPGPEDPAMSRVAPQECIFYTAWAGTAPPDANSRNHTEQLLAEPQVQQAMQRLQQSVVRGIGRIGRLTGAEGIRVAQQAMQGGQILMSHPAAIFVTGVRQTAQGLEIHGGGLANVGDDAGRVRNAMEKLQRTLAGNQVETVGQGNEAWHRFRPTDSPTVVTWGIRGKYLIVGMGPGMAEGIVQRMGSATPPKWLAEIDQMKLPRRAAVAYINVQGIENVVTSLAGTAQARGILETSGLSKVTSIATVTGLDQSGFVSRTLTRFDGQPQGLYALSTQALTPADLARIPEQVQSAAALKIDPARVWDTGLSLAYAINPDGRRQVEQGIRDFEAQTKVNLRQDLIASLGDAWSLYNTGPTKEPLADKAARESGKVPNTGEAQHGPLGRPLSGMVLVVPVRDPARFNKARTQLMAALQAAAADKTEGGRAGDDAAQFLSNLNYRLTISRENGQEIAQLRFGDPQSGPSIAWAFSGNELVLSPTFQNVVDHMARGKAPGRSLADVPQVASMFQAGGKPVFVWYQNTQKTFDQLYPRLEALSHAWQDLGRVFRNEPVTDPLLPPADVVRKHLQPAVAEVRWTSAGLESFVMQTPPGANLGVSGPAVLGVLFRGSQVTANLAARDESMGQLRLLAAAIDNYQRAHNRLPPTALTDAQGHPLLSWRVAILPLLGQEALYKQFALNEPWDSEHNRQLIGQMPAIFKAPRSKAGAGRTNYLAVTTENSAMGRRHVKPQIEGQLPQADRNTIMLVEVSDSAAVPWTQPQDYRPDPDRPLRGLVGLRQNGFLAVMASGTPRFVAAGTDPVELMDMFTVGPPVTPSTPRTARKPEVPANETEQRPLQPQPR